MDGKKSYPKAIDATTQGHPTEPHMDESSIIDLNDPMRDKAREALADTNDPEEEIYLEALITVIDYHRDPTFDETALF